MYDKINNHKYYFIIHKEKKVIKYLQGWSLVNTTSLETNGASKVVVDKTTKGRADGRIDVANFFGFDFLIIINTPIKVSRKYKILHLCLQKMKL